MSQTPPPEDKSPDRPKDAEKSPSRASKPSAREERLAKALRDNLRRRKVPPAHQDDSEK